MILFRITVEVSQLNYATKRSQHNQEHSHELEIFVI